MPLTTTPTTPTVCLSGVETLTCQTQNVASRVQQSQEPEPVVMRQNRARTNHSRSWMRAVTRTEASAAPRQGVPEQREPQRLTGHLPGGAPGSWATAGVAARRVRSGQRTRCLRCSPSERR
ncbi:hypothetical protein CAOG_009305 [Capsaspora owczarzaki ATCC 30864]|uniref:Uncharacterized protein n=1 Tax=Capsaspora owczarzaki (strain ATCC 30864) TaxID=595528 RepID=A0A0D2WIF7_CAPO3|nr:hypothetical protein CAOG_009305 [Capsaspora owczarzaki ATCC 30864]